MAWSKVGNIKGPRGVSGPAGSIGPRGLSTPGREGKDGEDAPYVTDISVGKLAFDEVEFIFQFSDGTTITSNAVKLPQSNNVYVTAGGGVSGGGGGSGSGADGDSAYEVAVANGFVGTEAAWLASLVGAPGTNGANGDSAYEVAVGNGFVGTEAAWLASLNGTNGVDGESAYEIAVSNGFVGTEAAWLASLVGTNGTNGVDGESAYEVAVANGFVGTEAAWLASLVGPTGPSGGADTFSSSVPASTSVPVNIIDYNDFGAVEYSIALLMGVTRSFLKLVVQKSEGDFVDEWDSWDAIPDMDGPGATVETIWESAVTLDIGIEATLFDGINMHLIFKNHEASTIKVSGARIVIPDFV